MTASSAVPPADDDIVAAVKELSGNAAGTTLSLAKLTAQLRSDKSWSLSEKRLKNVLHTAGIKTGLQTRDAVSGNAGTGEGDGDEDEAGQVEAEGVDHSAGADASASKKKSNRKKKSNKGNKAVEGAAGGVADDSAVPTSRIDPFLSFPEGIKLHVFGAVKGRGLVADRDFKEGDIVFSEEAFIATPPGSQTVPTLTGKLCGYCFLPMESAPLAVRCEKGGSACEMRFCNRLCQSRAQSTTHSVLCPGVNAAIKPLLAFLSSNSWLSLSSVTRQIARIIASHTPSPPPSTVINSAAGKPASADLPPASVEETLTHLSSFATVSELERRARNPGWSVEQKSFLTGMKEAHRLVSIGLDPYSTEGAALREKARKKWTVKPDFPKDVAQQLFTWENFLRMLGRANCNMESHGSMFLVHAHLNHSCEPNCHVRHNPVRGYRAATRISLVAQQTIASGTELTIPYQHPETPLRRRRLCLWREYMFGPCECPRCLREIEALDPEERRRATEEWTVDEQADEEIQMRANHAEALEEKRRYARDEGTEALESAKDLNGLEEELRESLGF